MAVTWCISSYRPIEPLLPLLLLSLPFSLFSDFAKDCGYQLDTHGHGFQLMSSGSIPAYGGDVRSRLISNSLLFACQCWGHFALANTPSMAVVRNNYTYMDTEFSRLDAERRPRAYAYKRAKTFFGCLSLEGSVATTGIEPLLLWTLSIERTLVSWPTKRRLRRHFPRDDGAGVAQLGAMADLKAMWDEALASEPVARTKYQVFMRTSNRVALLSRIRVKVAAIRQLKALPGRDSGERADLFNQYLATVTQAASTATAAILAHEKASTVAEKASLAPAATAAHKARAENGLLWDCAGLASSLINSAAALHFTRHIPTLVAAYTWFSTSFSLRFTHSEVLALTVAEAIDRLPAEDSRRTGRTVLAGFYRVWSLLQDAFGQYDDVCAHGDASETVIPKFDAVANPVRLSSVLNLRDAEAPDVFARMLSERLVRMVNVSALPTLSSIPARYSSASVPFEATTLKTSPELTLVDR